MSFINTFKDKDGKETSPVLTNLNIVPTTGGGIIADVSYDALTITYPESHVEIFRYFIGGVGGTLQATVTATYESSSKKNLISLVRS